MKIETLQSPSLLDEIRLYKSTAKSADGYLNTSLFQRMRDGQDDDSIKRFFAGPFAEVRTWLPQMFGLYVARFPDHPLSYVVTDNLSDEFGKYLGRDKLEPSHALLYRRILDELDVPVAIGTVSTPLRRQSDAAMVFYDWFLARVQTESPEYLIGHFLAYEITDTLDFPDYMEAAKRIWPGRGDLHTFFREHAASDHDISFARDLQPLHEQNRIAMNAAMENLLTNWTAFYVAASQEVSASGDDPR